MVLNSSDKIYKKAREKDITIKRKFFSLIWRVNRYPFCVKVFSSDCNLGDIILNYGTRDGLFGTDEVN